MRSIINESPAIVDRRKLYKTLAVVAIPIALQSLIASSLSLVDNVMVGALGETELAAVGIGIQIFFIHWMVMFGFTSGSTTFMAQFWGVRGMSGIRKTTGFAVTVCMSVSLVFFVVAFFFPEQLLSIFTDKTELIKLARSYVKIASITFFCLSITVPLTGALRSTQQTRVPLYISALSFATNTFLNYVFIFGNFGAPRLGLAGAALATAIARVLELVLTLLVVFGMKNKIAGPVREFFSWNRELAVRITKNAIPTTLNETLWGLATSMYVVAFARTSVTEYAAFQASEVINNLFVMAAFSIGDAILIIVGQRLGEGKLEYAYQIAKRLLLVATVIGLIAGLLLILCSKPLVGFFGFTKIGAEYASLILLVYGLSMSIVVFNSVMITGVLRSGGDTKFAMISETCCIWGIGVTMAFLSALVFKWPIYICALAVKSEEIIKNIILGKRFLSKKWVKNVITGLENTEKEPYEEK